MKSINDTSYECMSHGNNTDLCNLSMSQRRYHSNRVCLIKYGSCDFFYFFSTGTYLGFQSRYDNRLLSQCIDLHVNRFNRSGMLIWPLAERSRQKYVISLKTEIPIYIDAFMKMVRRYL